MATARQIAANRRNARRSTGPRSRAGGKRASRNSFRHGLAAGITTNAERIKRVERLARKFAGATTDIVTLEWARTIAQAEYDLAQVRRVKAAVMSSIMILGGFETPDALQSLGQLKHKAKRLETPGGPTPPPDDSADAIQMALSELIRLDRYERRAATRLERALHILLDHKRDETT
jgi:crotonobetainyl-CoA:carnitine CoA-transferase CaiB-like acyl-CoA transferase